ncbi:hypothetical protein [Natronorubrum texcoconense]|uniref:Uncharacterized protein n=1 Tax=Natronorubrum texcoconense TaxID=1095776 RepID=A0A1G9H9X3_9EURY|nr:hypothetical protein [Natronorubrum texcoconense]SDL09689.1 hypothetical protein SAMN04515672_0163 [Natronorubrum texcoconense]
MTETDARGLERPAKPTGPLSSIFWEHDCRLAAARTHATFEGYDVPPRAVLEGYDRALHPWVRGWRPGEVRETLRSKFDQVIR